MPQGGARNRSGPPPDPTSGRSEARGYKVAALPAEGYAGPIPQWPLSYPHPRELHWWTWAWRTPQACAWAMPSQAWRAPIVAQWCRVFTRCEDPQVIPGVLVQLHRLGDQIGLTTAGLREMGWAVAMDELAERREVPAPVGPVYDPRGELKAQGG
jgi:hypothetical protein